MKHFQAFKEQVKFPLFKFLQRNWNDPGTADPWTMWGVRDNDPPHSGKSEYDSTVGPPHLWFCTQRLSNFGLCSTIVYNIEKNLWFSGPVQYKPTLFKSQLYFLSLRNHTWEVRFLLSYNMCFWQKSWKHDRKLNEYIEWGIAEINSQRNRVRILCEIWRFSTSRCVM